MGGGGSSDPSVGNYQDPSLLGHTDEGVSEDMRNGKREEVVGYRDALASININLAVPCESSHSCQSPLFQLARQT